MFLYLRLVLAHFIADYPLQTNRVYQLKIKGMRGQFLHAGIHALTYTLFLFPYWSQPQVWLFVPLIGSLHLVIDILKVKMIDRTKLPVLFTYTLDQVLHLSSLLLIFLFPFSQIIPPASASQLLSWYWNDSVVIFWIGFLFATYFTTYFMECWRASLKAPVAHIDGYTLTPMVKYLGIWERGAMMALAATPHLLFAVPFVLLLRLPMLWWLRRNGRETAWFLNPRDMIVGMVLSVAAGVTVLNFSQSL